MPAAKYTRNDLRIFAGAFKATASSVELINGYYLVAYPNQYNTIIP